MNIYEAKLNRICDAIQSMPGTGGARALKAIIWDLEGDGPIGELLHTLDQKHFDMAIDLLVEFRKTGRYEAFNTIHGEARRRIVKKEEQDLF